MIILYLFLKPAQGRYYLRATRAVLRIARHHHALVEIRNMRKISGVTQYFMVRPVCFIFAMPM
jgi:hypothetical protein